MSTIAEVSAELQALQRLRTWVMKSRIMIANRLQATVAGTIGYHSGLKDSDRVKLFGDANKLITRISNGEDHPLKPIVMTTLMPIEEYDRQQSEFESAMVKLCKTLPIVSWVEHSDQRGFGIKSLATLIGETGDLNNYENPAKVWRRMGCAPYTKDGETLMGSSWRSRSSNKKGQTKMAATDWEDFGYSPRRRAIVYVIGENLIKQNGQGPYRRRWLEAKARAVETHPEWDWKPCDKCGGKNADKCNTCGGTGVKCGHAHKHGMLLASKLLMKNLWLEWTGTPYRAWSEQ